MRSPNTPAHDVDQLIGNLRLIARELRAELKQPNPKITNGELTVAEGDAAREVIGMLLDMYVVAERIYEATPQHVSRETMNPLR